MPSMRQSGYVTLLFLAGLVGLLFVTSSGYLRAREHAQHNQATPDRAAYLRDCADRLGRWYAMQSGVTGAQAGQIDMAATLAAAGITPRYNLQAASSQRLADGTVAWHVFVLWLPEPLRVQGTAIDAATGVFTEGTLISTGQPAQITHARIDGRAIQLRLYAESGRRVRELAGRLETWFGTQRATHPLAPASTNWFRAASCAAVDGGELPCYDTYQDVTTTAVPNSVGLSGGALTNAWGGAIQVSNLVNSSTTSPFSMSVQSLLPWGGVMQVLAQEP